LPGMRLQKHWFILDAPPSFICRSCAVEVIPGLIDVALRFVLFIECQVKVLEE
jgi:hypothetical protein